MPAFHYYTVTQIRRVEVRALSTVDAARIADSAFGELDNVAVGDAGGGTLGPIHITELMIQEKR